MLKATIILEYDGSKTAAAVARSLSPDNFVTPTGLSIKTEIQNDKVITEIVLEGKLVTLIATIDDLLSAASTAEKTLKVLKEK